MRDAISRRRYIQERKMIDTGSMDDVEGTKDLGAEQVHLHFSLSIRGRASLPSKIQAPNSSEYGM